MEKNLEYGPYTPQEVERITKWLKERNIGFSLIKDEEAEKLGMMNDGQTLVNRVEYRTEAYLGQIFYVQLSDIEKAQQDAFEKEFTVRDEYQPEKSFSMSEQEELRFIAERTRRQKQKKKFVSSSLVFAIILLIAFSFIGTLLKNLGN